MKRLRFLLPLTGILSFWIVCVSLSHAGGEGLVLHFDFDDDFSGGTVPDLSGNGNHGLQFNPTNWVASTNGVFGGQAAQFTYVGFMTNDPPQLYPLTQYIGVTNPAGFATVTNTTISVWAHFQVASNDHNAMFLMDNGYNTLFASSPSAASNSWTWGRGSFQNYLTFWVYPAEGGRSSRVTWPNDSISSSNPSTTNFHLYTVTIDCPGNQIIAYYDGEPYMTNQIGLPWLRIYGCAALRWLCIGASSHDGTPQWSDDKYPNSAYFSGRMDDLRIYDRTLSAGEVRSLYIGQGTRAETQLAAVRQDSSIVLSWVGLSNAWYQLEWRSNLTSGAWIPLGDPVLSTGQTDSATDSVLGAPARFYRVHPLP